MEIQTKFHGSLVIEKESIVTFSQGLPGFEDEKEFVILELFDQSPYRVLQSVTHAYIAFVMIEPWMFDSTYEFDLPNSVMNQLDIKSSSDVMVYNFLTLASEVKKTTLNLLAPVIVHQEKKQGMQIVLENTKYTTKYPIVLEEC